MEGVILKLTFVLGVAAALPQVDKSKLNSRVKEWYDNCVKETGFNKSVSIDVDNVPRSAKCFVACLLEKEGSLKASGALDVDSIKNSETFTAFKVNERLNSEFLFNVLENCAKDEKILADDKCDTAHNLIMCVYAKLPDF